MLYLKYRTTKGTLHLYPECTIPEELLLPYDMGEIPKLVERYLATWEHLNQLPGIDLLTEKQVEALQRDIERDKPLSDILRYANDDIKQQLATLNTIPLETNTTDTTDATEITSNLSDSTKVTPNLLTKEKLAAQIANSTGAVEKEVLNTLDMVGGTKMNQEKILRYTEGYLPTDETRTTWKLAVLATV